MSIQKIKTFCCSPNVIILKTIKKNSLDVGMLFIIILETTLYVGYEICSHLSLILLNSQPANTIEKFPENLKR